MSDTLYFIDGFTPKPGVTFSGNVDGTTYSNESFADKIAEDPCKFPLMWSTPSSGSLLTMCFVIPNGGTIGDITVNNNDGTGSQTITPTAVSIWGDRPNRQPE